MTKKYFMRYITRPVLMIICGTWFSVQNKKTEKKFSKTNIHPGTEFLPFAVIKIFFDSWRKK